MKRRAVNSLKRIASIAAIVAILVSTMLGSVVIQPATPVYAVTTTYSTAGTFTWTAPAGVTSVTVEVWGGGGKGGTADSWLLGFAARGGGGGGGAYSKKADIAVTPGNGYTVRVGAGATTTAAGGDSYFINTATVLAKGGQSVATNNANGAAGGQASAGVGDIKYSGGSGANGIGSYGGGGGSSAGTSANGNNGSGSTGGAAPSGGGAGGNGRSGSAGGGSVGSEPGGGGGGGYSTFCFLWCPARNGGTGAAGKVLITYKYNTTTTVTETTGTYGGTTSLAATLTVTGGGAVNGKTINFTLNGQAVGSAVTNAAGVASIPAVSLAGFDAGTYVNAVSASFAGDVDYVASNGAANLIVNPKALTITADNRVKTYGDTVTFAGTEFTASGLIGSDTVTSVTLTSDGAAAEATVAGSPYLIVPSDASGTGLSNYTITYINGALTVNKANQTIAFDALPVKTVGDPDFQPGATASSGLTVSYSSSNTSVATIVDGNIHIVGAGTSTITASQPGDSNYNTATPVDQILTVNPQISIEITAPSEISDWVLSPAGSGENTRTGELIINVTPDDANWTVTAQDLDGATVGYMTQWDGSSYGTNKLANPLRVQGHSEISLPDGGVIASGTGDSTVTITFKQYVEWTDTPDDYRIMVTFTGAIVP